MKDRITSYKFKPGFALEFEILPVKDLHKHQHSMLTAPHRADFYHIIWIHSGNGEYMVDFLPVKFSADTILFINKGKVHGLDRHEKFDATFILFTDNFFCRHESDTRFLHSTILFHDLMDNVALELKEGKAPLYSILQLIHGELLDVNKMFHYESLQNHLHNFLILADREKRSAGFTEISKGADVDYTVLFNKLLDAHFTKVRSVKEYSDKIHISEKRLGKATSEVLGKSPKEIINDRVLLEAKRLLVYTSQSIKEISFQLGFAEPTNFIKYFKLHSGITPSKFRASYP